MDSDSFDVSYLYRVLALKKTSGMPILDVRRDIFKHAGVWEVKNIKKSKFLLGIVF
jgi:hypothetical protein